MLFALSGFLTLVSTLSPAAPKATFKPRSPESVKLKIGMPHAENDKQTASKNVIYALNGFIALVVPDFRN